MHRVKLALPSIILMVIIGCCLVGIINNIFLGVGTLLFIFVWIYEIVMYSLRKKGKVEIKTPDGSDQPYHPSVVYFDDGWRNHKYWMAYTPFPIGAKPYRDRWEYPCIAVSENGIDWKDNNNNKPLDDLTIEQVKAKDYFSDTHLVYNDLTDNLECYYRLSEEKYQRNDQKGVWLFRRCTSDGIHWTEREIIISPEKLGLHGDHSPAISPSVVFENNIYKMWYVIEKEQQMTIHMVISENGIEWGAEHDCHLYGMDVNPWHIDCVKDGDRYLLLTYDFSQKIVLWESKDGIDFDFKKIILCASHQVGSFYKMSLYRSCLVKIKNTWNLYFSAGNNRRVGIGLMQGNNLENMQVISCSNNFLISDFLMDMYEKYLFLFRWGLWKAKRILHMDIGESDWL